MLLHLALLFLLFISGATSLGINYGQIGNNLPPPDKVLDMLTALRITKVRIYDTNPQVLSAFANSKVDLIVTIENQMLAELTNPQQALQWVTARIKPYVPATRITEIAVGNEVFSENDMTLVETLVPAMLSIHAALTQLGLSFIKLSTPSSLAVLEESYPPSAGSFKPEITGIMTQFLEFLSRTKAPFWINAYPYFAYKDDPNGIPLEYVLFNPNPGMVDPFTRLHYDNMLYAQADAVYFAMAKMGFEGIEVRISETGWPSKGDPNENGATIQNAANYNRNLLRRQMANEGTPMRPNVRLEIYLFALFNENLKPGPTSERNYGLYQPDGTMAYNVGLSSFKGTSSISLTSSAPTKGGIMGYYQSLVYWMFVYLMTYQVFMRRRF
ncbi:glucan endo-1,3-beta-glucosidase 11-like [Cucurbita pepo subsp. pepo]|uniref:glucan endo-1,3-beta-glucosidase 11-like n=1 Tax=Cucurbita pepo subsp. pepo TaxID=3664 RepID=UPI000C9D8417|nr:glucan endo-1,3-beta-glucosidase 11-like [Cucurbita pepo subsp. pepo]